jgi:hypothetical protein
VITKPTLLMMLAAVLPLSSCGPLPEEQSGVCDAHGVRIFGHGGGAPGIEAQLKIYPTLGCTVVILANLDSAATPIYNQINQILASRQAAGRVAGSTTSPEHRAAGPRPWEARVRGAAVRVLEPRRRML